MNNTPPRRNEDGPRVNEQIRIPKIRLVDENGEMVVLSPFRKDFAAPNSQDSTSSKSRRVPSRPCAKS